MRETWWTSTQLIQCNAPKYDAMHVWLRAMTRCMLACGCIVVQPQCLACKTSKNAKTKRVTLYSPCWSCSTSISNYTKWWPQSNRCFLRLYGIMGVYLQTQTCADYMEHSCLNCRQFMLSNECQKELWFRRVLSPTVAQWKDQLQFQSLLESKGSKRPWVRRSQAWDLPIQDDDGSSDWGREQTPMSPARGQPAKPCEPVAAAAAAAAAEAKLKAVEKRMRSRSAPKDRRMGWGNEGKSWDKPTGKGRGGVDGVKKEVRGRRGERVPCSGSWNEKNRYDMRGSRERTWKEMSTWNFCPTNVGTLTNDRDWEGNC